MVQKKKSILVRILAAIFSCGPVVEEEIGHADRKPQTKQRRRAQVREEVRELQSRWANVAEKGLRKVDEAEGMVLEKIKECDGPLQPEPKKKRKRTGELPDAGYLVVEQL